MLLPWRSKARALFRTSNAVSVPSRDMRRASCNSCWVVWGMGSLCSWIEPKRTLYAGGLVGRVVLSAFLQPQPRHQGVSFAEPGALAPSLIAGHGGAVVENLLQPLPRLIHASLLLKEQRIVVIKFGAGRDLSGLLEQLPGFLGLTGLGISMRQQSYAAMEVISGIGANGALQIRHRRSVISQLDLRDSAPIKRIHRIGALRDRAVVTSASPGKIPIVQIKQSQLFVIPSRRIIQDRA